VNGDDQSLAQETYILKGLTEQKRTNANSAMAEGVSASSLFGAVRWFSYLPLKHPIK
jgi:hypothetical protein